MPHLLRITVLAATAMLLGGCLSTFDAYPVAGNPVNPAPAPGYRVECSTRSSALTFVAGDLSTTCVQVIDPQTPPVRARG